MSSLCFRNLAVQEMRFATHFLLLLFVLLSACSDPTPSQIQLLHRGINGDPHLLDPQRYSGSDSAMVLIEIGEGLVAYDGNGSVVPGVAKTWRISDDGRTYSFELRPNLVWSNGDKIDSSDVVRTFRRLVDPSTLSPNSNNLLPVLNADQIIQGIQEPEKLGVVAISENVVDIQLERSTPYFLQILAHPSLQLFHQDINSGEAETGATSSQVSNGPYRVSERILGSTIVLVRNENYWNAASVKIGSVKYHVVSEDIEPIRFEAGELDITDSVGEAYFDKFRRTSPSSLRVAPALNVYYYGFNLRNPKFSDDILLRRALYLSIDRKTLTDKVIGRGEVPAYGVVPPGIGGYKSIEAFEGSESDRVSEARRLFRESNFAKNNESSIQLRFNTGGGHERIALAVASMWREVLGLEVELVGEEFRVFLENVRNGGDTEMFRLSWSADFQDPYAFLQIFESGNSSNLSGFKSDAVDQALRQANSTADPDTRNDMLREVEKSVVAQAIVIPVYFYVSKHLVSERVIGWQTNVMDVHPSQYLSLAK